MSEDRFYMNKTEEVDDAQERYKSAPVPVLPPQPPAAPGRAAPLPAHPPLAASGEAPPRPVELARVATAGAALALALAFFHPAIRDAIDRKPRAAATTTPRQPMYLHVNATPRGATVLIDGAEVGQSPLATQVDCVAGTPVRVEISARGYAPYSASVPCAAGGDADVSPALQR
jgi:hypothetical protein